MNYCNTEVCYSPGGGGVSRDNVNFCRIDKNSRNGAKLQIALFNLLYVKEDRLSKKF